MANVNWQTTIISLGVCKRNLVDIFYHIHQVAAYDDPTLKSTGGASLFGRNGLTDVSQILTRTGETWMRLLYAREIVSMSMHQCTPTRVELACIGVCNKSPSVKLMMVISG